MELLPTDVPFWVQALINHETNPNIIIIFHKRLWLVDQMRNCVGVSVGVMGSNVGIVGVGTYVNNFFFVIFSHVLATDTIEIVMISRHWCPLVVWQDFHF